MSRNTIINLTPIALNAEGETAPEWIQLTPAGPAINGRDGRSWSLRDPEALIATFRERGGSLPVDCEHATQVKGSKGEEAPAVGYIVELEARNGELWGRVDWNAKGKELIGSKAYRYLSPVFTYSRVGHEIGRLVSAGLTNLPNLSLTALNSEGADEEPAMNKAILEALGLKEGASETDVLTAINRLKTDELEARNRAEQPDADRFVPKADYDLAMNRVREFETSAKERETAEIEAAVDAATQAGKIAPASRDYHIAACRQEGGLDRFKAMVEAAPELAGGKTLKGKPDAGGSKLSEEEIAVCRQLGMDEKDFAEAKAKEEQ